MGYPIGYFFGYETNGIFQNQEQIDNAEVTQQGAEVGDLIFVDQNGDGKINFRMTPIKRCLVLLFQNSH